MNHLTDSQLNEYLDNALDTSARYEMESHLSSCNECRARLEELQMLFSDLGELPEVKPAHDLTSSVMAHLPNKQLRLWTPAFAAQLGATLGVLLWLSIQIAELITPSNIRFPHFVIPTLQLTMPNFQVPNPYSLFSIPYSLLSFPYSLFSIPHFPSSIFNLPIYNISTFNIIVITTGVFILWLVGNLSLLRSRLGVQK